jgi:hypothetical protein
MGASSAGESDAPHQERLVVRAVVGGVITVTLAYCAAYVSFGGTRCTAIGSGMERCWLMWSYGPGREWQAVIAFAVIYGTLASYYFGRAWSAAHAMLLAWLGGFYIEWVNASMSELIQLRFPAAKWGAVVSAGIVAAGVWRISRGVKASRPLTLRKVFAVMLVTGVFFGGLKAWENHARCEEYERQNQLKG